LPLQYFLVQILSMDLSGSGRILHVEELRILYNLQQRLLELLNKKREMVGTRGTHETQKFWYIILVENTDIKKFGKWIFIKSDGRLWNQSNRFRTEPTVRSCEHVTNRMFLHNAQNFLIGWATFNFSLKILLYGITYMCGQVQKDNTVTLAWALTLAWLEYHNRQSASYLNRGHK
jgi:hypothetical protein